MCLIVFAFKEHPDYSIILGANRDELYERPMRSAQFWKEYPKMLAGRDLSAGGTWMGVNRRGQWAALTNYRDPSIAKENPPSRGFIVRDFLMQEKGSANFLESLQKRAHEYMGFNILAGSPKEIHHYSNQEQKIHTVEPGIHGLSNHLLDTPWPKVQRSKTNLKKLIESDHITSEALFDLLLDDRPAPENQLPNTGIPREQEKAVSPIFIKTDRYGTRCSTILLIDKNGNVTFEERRFIPGTMKVEDTNRFEFAIEH